MVFKFKFYSLTPVGVVLDEKDPFPVTFTATLGGHCIHNTVRIRREMVGCWADPNWPPWRRFCRYTPHATFVMMMMTMYLFTTVPHPHGHWQLQELLGNNVHVFYAWLEVNTVNAPISSRYKAKLQSNRHEVSTLCPVRNPYNETRRSQCFFLSRNGGSFTPKNSHLYYLKKTFLDQSMQNNSLFKFENRSTGRSGLDRPKNLSACMEPSAMACLVQCFLFSRIIG